MLSCSTFNHPSVKQQQRVKECVKQLLQDFIFLRLGENHLSVETVEVIADVLRVSESIVNLG